jgi:hypothetical protein
LKGHCEWDKGYISARCEEICRDEDAVAAILRYPSWPPELLPLKDVLLACLERKNLTDQQVNSIEKIRKSIDDYPDSIPQTFYSQYSLGLYREDIKFEVKLRHKKIIFYTNALPTEVNWKVHFWGTGRRDRREGDATAAFKSMCQAALDPNFVLR